MRAININNGHNHGGKLYLPMAIYGEKYTSISSKIKIRQIVGD